MYIQDSEEDLVSSLLKISHNTVWVILMTGGGHFAGAVFKGSVKNSKCNSMDS